MAACLRRIEAKSEQTSEVPRYTALHLNHLRSVLADGKQKPALHTNGVDFLERDEVRGHDNKFVGLQ